MWQHPGPSTGRELPGRARDRPFPARPRSALFRWRTTPPAAEPGGRAPRARPGGDRVSRWGLSACPQRDRTKAAGRPAASQTRVKRHWREAVRPLPRLRVRPAPMRPPRRSVLPRRLSRHAAWRPTVEAGARHSPLRPVAQWGARQGLPALRPRVRFPWPIGISLHHQHPALRPTPFRQEGLSRSLPRPACGAAQCLSAGGCRRRRAPAPVQCLAQRVRARTIRRRRPGLHVRHAAPTPSRRPCRRRRGRGRPARRSSLQPRRAP